MTKKLGAALLLIPALLGGVGVMGLSQPAEAAHGTLNYRYVPSSTGGTYYWRSY